MARLGTSLVVPVVILACLVGLSSATFAPAANNISNCPALPPHNATVIQDLRPMDVKVIMAMGDSIFAGLAIMGRDTNDVFSEYRGLSAVIGGDEGAITTANFFKHYRPDLIGASIGTHFWQLPGMPYRDSDHLNAAISDARGDQLMTELDHLVKKMTSNPAIDMENDWKVLTLLIGANDACGLCWNIFLPSIESVGDKYEKQLREVIESAYKRVPRLFFNVLPMFNVSQVYYLSLTNSYCATFHDLLPVECACAFDSDQHRRDYVDAVVGEYNKRLFKIYDEWKAKNLTTFALQIQPFSAGLMLPSLFPYISNLDCFHPSRYSHERLAIANWNSMLTPNKLKPHKWDPDATLICPDENTRLYVD